MCDLSEDNQLRRALGGRQRRDAVAQRTLRALAGNVLLTFYSWVHLETRSCRQLGLANALKQCRILMSLLPTEHNQREDLPAAVVLPCLCPLHVNFCLLLPGLHTAFRVLKVQHPLLGHPWRISGCCSSSASLSIVNGYLIHDSVQIPSFFI